MARGPLSLVINLAASNEKSGVEEACYWEGMKGSS